MPACSPPGSSAATSTTSSTSTTGASPWWSAFRNALLRRSRRDHRALRYVSAGHNPPLLRRASGDVEALPPTAMLLGMTADTPVEARQVQIGPADRLLA